MTPSKPIDELQLSTRFSKLPMGALLPAFLALLMVSSLQAQIEINVQADHVIHPVPRLLTGACIEDVNHEIYGGIYSQMIFGESFQEPAPSPTINDFKAYGGSWLVRDGTVHIDATDGPKLVSEHVPFKDGVVAVEMLFAGREGQNAGLLARVGNPRVGADKFTGYEVSLDPGAQTLRLGRHRNNFEPIKDVRCDVALGRWIPLEVRVSGSVIEILVDGKSMLRHDDAERAILSGTVALRAWHRKASYRNLSIRSGNRAETLAFRQPQTPMAISGMWGPVTRGNAVARYAIVEEHPFIGTQSQQMIFVSGDGEIGVENQGLNRSGINYVAGKPYEGYVWVCCEKPATLFVAMESRDGSREYAEQSLNVTAGDWQRLPLSLTPSATDPAGRLSLKLKQAGAVTLGHVFLQPGDWGRFKGLAVRRDVAGGLIHQGITVLRYGGSMVNHTAYKWKNMIGPRNRRPPTPGTWYRYSSNGWGIPDFMAFCEAAGFEYVPAFNMGETPQDMADFIDYAMAPTDNEWGRKRAADGHEAPYTLRYMELGNEERVDEAYAGKFESLAAAIWSKAPNMILVVGDFAYDQPIKDPFNFTGAASRITTLAAQRRILKFAKQHGGEVWFDVHIGTDHPVPFNPSLTGMFSFTDALDKFADGAKHKVVVFELNAGNHAQKRALANAMAINAIERDGRIPIVASANGLQPDKQNDNGWDQGLLFLNPSQVWLQPPGYVTQMLSSNYLPQLVQCDVNAPGTKLDANAKRSEEGKTLVLQVVNPDDKAVTAQIHLAGFVPGNQAALVSELSGPLESVNTADKPAAITPQQNQWTHGMKGGTTHYTFPPHSFTVIRFQ